MVYDTHGRARSIYIHWPFCPYKCHFCPFVALASHDAFMGQYHDALKSEIKTFAASLQEHWELDTIFFGGGTPSTYPDDLLLDMSGTLKEVFSFGSQTEITIEVNPGTVRPGQLPLWRDVGINRLSIGVQSMKDSVLVQLNRHQRAADVLALLENAQQLFDNISVDLILGLPGVSQDEWKELIQAVVTWPIKHVSVYFLTVHEDTPLYFKVKTGRTALPDDETMVSLFYWTRDYLEIHGLEQYEMSNFARPGYHSRHNSAYWDRVPYKAFGLGACSFDGKNRFQNEKNLLKYMEKASQGGDVTTFCESLEPRQIRLERLMLGLRRAQGVSRDVLMCDFSKREQDQFQQTIALFKQQGWLVERDNRYTLTPAGLVVENEIIARLAQ